MNGTSWKLFSLCSVTFQSIRFKYQAWIKKNTSAGGYPACTVSMAQELSEKQQERKGEEN